MFHRAMPAVTTSTVRSLRENASPEVETGGQREQPEPQQHTLRVQPGDTDVADDEGYERAEIAERAGELRAVEPVAAEVHARRSRKAVP